MKTYNKPRMFVFGNVEDLTRAKVEGGGFDGYFTWDGQGTPTQTPPPGGATNIKQYSGTPSNI
ncbi:MAG: hypothetical protein WCJ56_08350 [bacterium]